MKISYAITVCDEFLEIQSLLRFLIKNKRHCDEIVVLVDMSKNSPTSELLGFLHKLSSNNNIILSEQSHNGDFSRWKNLLNKSCSGDYIFQIDADEYPNLELIENLPSVLEQNSAVDLYVVPRVNTVEGLTQDHILKWGWNLNADGWVNWPDFQTRIYKNTPEIEWVNKVHEVIKGNKTIAHLPMEEEWALYHPKDIKRQEKQNAYYETL
tara:strand:- start:853 stop:1482 length:630 start_codon:yes stop_codon:yes gene_type:complete